MAKGQNIIVEKNDVDSRLSTFIVRKNKSLNFNSANILCRKGLVRVNGVKKKASYRLMIGDIVTFPNLSLKMTDNETTTSIEPKLAQLLVKSIIFKDNYLIALNKPEGLAVQGGSTQGARHVDAYRSTLQFEASDAPRLIHRLDKDTSGVLLLARDVKAANTFANLFKKNMVEKIYWAFVEGIPKKEEGKLESYIGEEDIWKPSFDKEVFSGKKFESNKRNKKKALTYYKVIEKIGSKYAWLELKPTTGRTHQLRIHCAELGNPIVGDRKYKNVEDKNSHDLPYSFKKLFLHARCVIFIHPISKKTIEIEAPLPKHMGSVWKHFGWKF